MSDLPLPALEPDPGWLGDDTFRLTWDTVKLLLAERGEVTAFHD